MHEIGGAHECAENARRRMIGAHIVSGRKLLKKLWGQISIFAEGSRIFVFVEKIEI